MFQLDRIFKSIETISWFETWCPFNLIVYIFIYIVMLVWIVWLVLEAFKTNTVSREKKYRLSFYRKKKNNTVNYHGYVLTLKIWGLNLLTIVSHLSMLAGGLISNSLKAVALDGKHRPPVCQNCGAVLCKYRCCVLLFMVGTWKWSRFYNSCGIVFLAKYLRVQISYVYIIFFFSFLLRMMYRLYWFEGSARKRTLKFFIGHNHFIYEFLLTLLVIGSWCS